MYFVISNFDDQNRFKDGNVTFAILSFHERSLYVGVTCREMTRGRIMLKMKNISVSESHTNSRPFPLCHNRTEKQWCVQISCLKVY